MAWSRYSATLNAASPTRVCPAAEWTATRVRDTGNGQLERQGDWNGRDRVLSLAVKGGGWQEDVEDAKYATTADAILPDAQTGFRCIETAR